MPLRLFTSKCTWSAALQGGRLNRKGLEALYLSLEPETAVAEFQQGSPFLPPGLLVSYVVSVIDFIGCYEHQGAGVERLLLRLASDSLACHTMYFRLLSSMHGKTPLKSGWPHFVRRYTVECVYGGVSLLRETAV